MKRITFLKIRKTLSIFLLALIIFASVPLSSIQAAALPSNLVESISIKKAPDKLTYKENEDLDLSGGEIYINYASGITMTGGISADMISGYDKNTPGKQTVYVTYEYCITSFEVEVIAKTLTSINVSTPPQNLVYFVGDSAIDVRGGVLTLNYDNDQTEEIPLSSSMISDFNTSKAGMHAVTVTYNGKTTGFFIEVQDIYLTSIELSTKPTTLKYLEGKDTLDISGGKLTLHYNNHTEKEISLTKDMVTGFDNTKVGLQTLTIKYNKFTTTYVIEILAKSIESIEVSSLPNKLKYLEEKDTLDTAGGAITVHYNNGTADIVLMEESMVTGFDNSTVGPQTLTVTYEGHSTPFEIQVTQKVLTAIEIHTSPTKYNYLEGDKTIDVTGGFLTLYYNNDTQSMTKITQSMISGFNGSVTGLQQVTVTYQGKQTSFPIYVHEKSLESIEVSTLPSMLEYLEGKDTLNLSGGKLTLNYDNGTTETINLSSDMISGFDNTMVGKQTLTVAYQGYTTEFEVEILAKSIVSIKISSLPNKLKYLERKETLDVTGGKITVYYNNNTEETILMDEYMIKGFDNSVVGPQILTVTYEERSTTYTITISAKSLSRIEVTTLPDVLEYTEGVGKLDVTGGKVTLVYNNDTTEIIDLAEDMVSGFDITKAGAQKITVVYNGKTTYYTVDVLPKELKAIELSTKPTTLKYLEGKDTLDISGGVLTLHYDNNTKKEINLTEDMVSGFDNAIVGFQTLIVTYYGFTTEFEIEILAKSLESIEISALPSKLEYIEGKDPLNLLGGKLALNYNNGTTETIILSSNMIAGFDNTIVGKQTLTVTYQDCTTEFEIEILAKSLVSINVSSMPNKLNYLEKKETLDVTGGKITLVYNNYTSKTIDLTEDMVSGFDGSVTGPQQVTVIYQGKQTSFTVYVYKKSLESIEISALPSMLEYLEGKDPLNLLGGKLSLNYDNGTTETIDLSSDMISGFDNTMVGKQTLTVTYQRCTTEFEIEILAKNINSIEVSALPNKCKYIERKETLDVTGGEITIYYNNDTTEVICMDECTITGFDNSTIGIHTLTVTYKDHTAKFNIEVLAKALSHIEISTLPSTLTYTEAAGKLDVTGGKVTLFYNNDTTEIIDLAEDMVSGFDITKAGTQKLTVVYNEKNTYYTVDVLPKELKFIELSTKPSTLKYLEGKDTLNTDGGRLTLIFNNNTKEEISLTKDMVTGFDNTKVGLQTLSVSYLGKTTRYQIEVIRKQLADIKVSEIPVNLTYTDATQELAIIGGKLTLFYNNDDTEVIEMTADIIKEYDCESKDVQTITVEYMGFEDKFEAAINIIFDGTIAILGDVDGNGQVNVKDATLIQKIIAELAPQREHFALIADVNHDGTVNVKDATVIQKHLAGFNTDYPVGSEIIIK